MPNPSINRRITLGSSVTQSTYDPMAIAFFNELATDPSVFMKNLYNDLFVSNASNMALHDRFYINGAEYEDNMTTSLVNPTSTKKSAISTPLFDKYVGIKDDESTTTAYNWHYTPSTNAVNVGLNDACWWIWFEPNRVLGNQMFGAANSGEHGSIRMTPYDLPPNTVIATVDPFKAQLNPNLTSVDLQGLYSMVWNYPTMSLYHNGSLVATGSKSLCTDIVTFPVYELAQNLNGTKTSSFQGTIFASGAGKSTINQTDLYNGLLAFHDTVPVWSFYGDSVTQGYLLPSPRTQCWPTLLCNGRGKAPFNNGVPNATIASFNATNMPLRGSTNQDYRIFLAWGLNDCVTYNTATYSTYLQGKITEALSLVASPSQIVIIAGTCTDPLGSQGFNTTNYLNYVAVASSLATSNGCQGFDLTTLGSTVANGELASDGVHLSITGATKAANYLIANVL